LFEVKRYDGLPKAPQVPLLILFHRVGREQKVSIARTLVSEQLIACINIIGPIRSIYRWNDFINDDREVPLLIKTRASL
jgi:periplasmic divalent cation tolerance protein